MPKYRSEKAVIPTLETNKNALNNTYNYKDKNDEFGVTEQQEEKIKEGMTYKEVIDILGGEGVECSLAVNAKDLSKQGVIRRWGNSDGSFVQIVFVRDDQVSNSMFFK